MSVRIIGGDHAGTIFLIPCITIRPSDLDLPFILERHQFPVQLAFSMSINNTQGQSVKNVGIHFQAPVFTHGQFYVAMSRCTSGSCVKILFSKDSTDNVTKNIVFPEALLKDTL